MGRVFRETLSDLNPWRLVNNPCLLSVEICAILVTAFALRDLIVISRDVRFDLQVALWLWLTVAGANFAKSLAAARGRAHADALRKAVAEVTAKRLVGRRGMQIVPASKLRPGDVVLCESNDLIPAEGEIIEGIAVVDESPITGESAPVIRESGTERSTVSAGTRVVSDEVLIRVTASPGKTFLERRIQVMKALEGKRSAVENSFHRLLTLQTLAFTVLVAAFTPLTWPLIQQLNWSLPESSLIPVALWTALLPTTISGLLSAISISSLDRTLRQGVLVASAKVLEVAANLHTVLFDKTGTVTIGNREAIEFIPLSNITQEELAAAARLCSIFDETPEGQSILRFAATRGATEEDQGTEGIAVVPFSTYTRMSGVDIGERSIRKGATAAIASWVRSRNGWVPDELSVISDGISREGGTPLSVADGNRVLGVVHLKDVIRTDLRERLLPLLRFRIRPVLITGDNPINAAAIAKQIGLNEYVPQSTAADKLAYIKAEQARGHLIAMVGDGANDAPALAQADIGMALNGGSSAAKEASNMLEIHNDPGKLSQVIFIARQLSATRVSISVFSVVSGFVTFLLAVPAIFSQVSPALSRWNLEGLHSPRSALLAACMLKTLLLLLLIPTAYWGAPGSGRNFRDTVFRGALLYAVLGVLLPVSGMWLLDLLITNLELVGR
jgi:potassium-transporting ATPase ATP-binding subunit